MCLSVWLCHNVLSSVQLQRMACKVSEVIVGGSCASSCYAWCTDSFSKPWRSWKTDSIILFQHVPVFWLKNAQKHPYPPPRRGLLRRDSILGLWSGQWHRLPIPYHTFFKTIRAKESTRLVCDAINRNAVLKTERG